MLKLSYVSLSQAALLASTILVAPHLALAADHNTAIDGNNGTLPLPTGQYITPQKLTNAVQQPLNPGLAEHPDFVAGMAVKSQLSPDGTTLAIICAGHNSLANSSGSLDVANSTQYIFLYDVSGAHKTKPALSQVIKQPNSFVGLVFSPDGNTLYGTGGADDAVYVYTKSGGSFAPAGTIALGHGSHNKSAGLGGGVEPNAGGLGISSDGTRLVVANNYNDSISVIDTGTRTVLFERDLRPFANEGTQGGAGGTYPYAVLVKGTGTDMVAYVTSDRDREVDVVNIGTAPGTLVTRIHLSGNGMGMTFNANQSRLYVAQDNTDKVAVIDTATNTVVTNIDARAPSGVVGPQTGASTTAVTLHNDTLYAVNTGANTIAVIPLTGTNANTVTGLIPTAYEPHDVTFSADGTWMYVINGKSDTGPNPKYKYGNTAQLTTVTYPGGNAAAAAAARAANQYQFQLERASLVSGAVPTASDLPALTAQAELNNFYNPAANPSAASDAAVMSFVRSHIQHVIYIIKENRTFDQMLGDLGNGSNGDPSLTVFGKRITPSFHRMASNFVSLDNFMDPGDGSMDGWSWSLQGRVTNVETITQQINYASVDRGLSYESEGSNRNVPVRLSSVAARDAATKNQFSAIGNTKPGGAANLLAGTGDHAATDAPFGIQNGYIFDAVLNAGGTVRNYGMLTNNIGSIGTKAAPITDPHSAGVVQVAPLNPSLADKTDLYFRGYDQAYPDLWRFNEWNREFQQFDATDSMPNFVMLRLAHDHTGSFGSALGGVDTPEKQQADNDYSVGRVVQAVANSTHYRNNTLIMVIEDDCQDGPDHYDSHRATAYVVGPYVKQGAVVSTRYSQVNMLRTIEDIFGTAHVNLNTAYQRPMADVFDTNSNGNWSFTALASTVLKGTTLVTASKESEVQYAEGPDVHPTHDAAYWARATRGFDFSDADRVPVALYNEVLWNGLMEGKPYPTVRTGLVLGREQTEN